MPPASKRARRHRRSWSELPHDLLSVILDRLTPAFGTRVRFRGVCKAWRATELAHPRPPMPWLAAPGHCVSLHDASIHRVPLPEDAAAAVCRGSFGNWLALVTPTGRPFLLNAFTMERIKLPPRKKMPMVKFVLSSALDSKSCTVAAILYNDDDDEEEDFGMILSKIVVCHIGREGSWRTITRAFELQDIIFFEGKLHALDANARVHVFQVGDLQRDKPWRPPVCDYVGRYYLGNAKLNLVVLHGKLRMVGRAFGRHRVPGCTHFTSNVGVFALGLGGVTMEKRLQPVKDFGEHAIFVGDACCDAFPANASSSGGGKIRENQICFVDDEKNVSLLTAYGCRPFRQLQSYDVRNSCLRTYQPPDEPSYGTWRCVTAQRFPHSSAMGPPPREALSWEERQLLDVANCLGAMVPPSYTAHKDRKAGGSRVTVWISVPKTAALAKYEDRSFTQRRPSANEAKQAAAYKATTFLRSRFRSVLDDSPWSSIPHYHSHVDEHEEEEEEEKAHSDHPDLFGFRHWYAY